MREAQFGGDTRTGKGLEGGDGDGNGDGNAKSFGFRGEKGEEGGGLEKGWERGLGEGFGDWEGGRTEGILF